MKQLQLKVITSDTCGCCKSYAPKIEELGREYGFGIEFIDINNTDMDLTSYDFSGIPLTVVYEDGMYKSYFVGDMARERIMQQLGLD